jgi:hypothetical protein
LDLTSRWSSQRLEINEELVTSTNLRGSLWCFKHKKDTGASLDYCRQEVFKNVPNKFGCRQIYFSNFENDYWDVSNDEFGYVDTESGQWLFNHEKITKFIESQLEKVKYCPLVDKSKVRKSIKEIPLKINPKEDTQWAFVSNTHESWFWREGKWVSNYGNSDFPGYTFMVGIKKLGQVPDFIF